MKKLLTETVRQEEVKKMVSPVIFINTEEYHILLRDLGLINSCTESFNFNNISIKQNRFIEKGSIIIIDEFNTRNKIAVSKNRVITDPDNYIHNVLSEDFADRFIKSKDVNLKRC